MKRIIVLSFLAALLAFGLASSALAQTKTITVNGTGIVTQDPDMVRLSLTIMTENSSIKDGITENTKIVENVREELTGIGIPKNDLITTNYSIWTNTRWTDDGEPNGRYYVVNYTFQVVVRDTAKLNEVLDTAANAGATNIDQLQHDIADKKSMFSEARKLALEDARAKAEEIAAEIGKTIVDVETVDMPEYAEVGNMRNNMMEYNGMGMGGGGETPAITSGAYQTSVTLRVTYVVE